MSASRIVNCLVDQWITMALFALTTLVMVMTAYMPQLNGNTLWRTLSQAIVITGLIGIALAHHFRGDQAKADEIARLDRENAGLRARLRDAGDVA